MGDTIEISTWPDRQNVFYEVTSSALVFFVKGNRDATIGLSRKLKANRDYWIVLSNYPHSYIKKEYKTPIKVETPSILNSEDYRKFWISWHGGYIKLGCGDDTSPILVHSNKVRGLRYITFDARTSGRSPIHWRFQLPPKKVELKLKSISGGEPRWVPAHDQLPDGAFIGGCEKEPLYIIKAPHRGSVTPGKFVPSLGLGFVPWGGDMNEKDEFEVLCGYNCMWVSSHHDRIPISAVVGGYSEVDMETLYVGRAAHKGHVIPGKVQPSHQVCYIPFEGREIAKSVYEILVVPNSNTRFANDFFIYDIHCESGSETDDDNELHEGDEEENDIDNQIVDHDFNDRVYGNINVENNYVFEDSSEDEG